MLFYKQGFFRQNQVHTRGFYLGHTPYGFAQLTLQGPLIINLLYKIGLSDLALVKHFKTNCPTLQHILSCNFQPQAVLFVLRYQNCGSVILEFIGNVFLLQYFSYPGSVFLAQIRIQNSVFRLVQPVQKKDQKHD